MRFLNNFLAKIRPIELLLISIVSPLFLIFLNLFLTYGCNFFSNENSFCSYFKVFYMTRSLIYLGNLDLFIFFVLLIIVLRMLSFKRSAKYWLPKPINFFILPICLISFYVVYDNANKFLLRYVYDLKPQAEWVINCKDEYIKTPFYSSRIDRSRIRGCHNKTSSRVIDIFEKDLLNSNTGNR